MRGRRKLSRVLRGLRATVSSPPFVGALVVLGLAAWAGAGTGARADAGAGAGQEMRIAIGAVAIAIGLFVGLLAEVLVRLRYRSARTVRRNAARVFVENAFVCLGVHASFVLWSMADSPQLYAARWYAKGGVARTIQVFATDVLGPAGVVVLAMAIAVIYVRPSRLVYAAHRAAAFVRRTLRRAATHLAQRLAASSLALVAGAMALRSIDAPTDAAAAPSSSPSASASAPTPTATATATATTTTTPTASSSSPSPRPNILLLAVGSLRADHLDARLAPNLTRLAARGARFDRAHVSIPRTLPSWVTILTGRHAHHHGIRSTFPSREDRARDLDALPQRLARAGYETGVVGDFAGDVFGRIDLGFAHVEAPSFDPRHQLRQRALERQTPLLPFLHSQLGRRLFPAMRELNDAADPKLLAGDAAAALHAMNARARGGPFFLTVFFSTAHAPYAAPAPYYARYTDPRYRGRFKYHAPAGLAGDAPSDAADVKQLRALYEGSVSAVDDAVARVLRALEREGLADDTIVIVTAEHGETLHDNGHGRGHGDHLFGDEGTHVPLVIFDPRAARAARSERIVRDVDVAPTLYELAGVAAPSDLDGRSLAPAVRGGDLEPRFAYAETELWHSEELSGLSPELRIPYPGIAELTELEGSRLDGGRLEGGDVPDAADIVIRRDLVPLTRMARHRMVRDERWKLVYVPTRKGVRYVLFDTVEDPGETRDLAASKPEEVARLKTELWAWMLRDPLMEQKDGFLVPRLTGALR